MRIGLIDLDTSHPEAWTPILREMGHEVVGVWDGGAVHPRGYAEEFARRLQIPRVFRSLEEARDSVDLAILHGCNWDTHRATAQPFLEAQKAVLVDKPVAGNIDDVAWFEGWVERGARLAGGSGLRHCAEAIELRRQWAETHAKAQTALCGCGVDDFNYGIHGYGLLAALLGGDACEVQHLSGHGQHKVAVRYADGRMGFVVIGASNKWLPFHGSVVTDQGIHQFQVEPSGVYRSLLCRTLPFLARESDEPPLGPREWLAPERWALAALQSRSLGGRPIPPDSSLPLSYNGGHFAEAYRCVRYPREAQTSN